MSVRICQLPEGCLCQSKLSLSHQQRQVETACLFIHWPAQALVSKYLLASIRLAETSSTSCLFAHKTKFQKRKKQTEKEHLPPERLELLEDLIEKQDVI